MTFNLWTFVLEVVNFVALAYVLHRLLYRPLHESIERRRNAVTQEQAEAESARKQADEMKQQLEIKLAELEQHRQEAMSQSRAQAEVDRKRILAGAEVKAQRLQDEARRALENEREEMLRGLSDEIVEHAVDLATRLLRQASDRTLQQQLERHLIEVFDGLSAKERLQLRNDWQADASVLVETASRLDDASINQLRDAVARVAGRALSLRIISNPGLISGVRLEIGGHLWDASIAGQLNKVPSPPQEVSSNV